MVFWELNTQMTVLGTSFVSKQLAMDGILKGSNWNVETTPVSAV